MPTKQPLWRIEIGTLEDIDVFGIKKEDYILSLAIILHISKQEIEIKELITRKDYRHKGFGTKLLKQLVENYKQKYKNMLVGTTENNIPYYVKQGFDKYEKNIKNFFIENYKEEIIDRDTKCIDIYYYSKDLSKKM